MEGIPTDRHGIPRLDDQADLRRLFDVAGEASGDGQDLREILRKSLDHDARGLMKKKTGGIFPSRRLSLKEKLRRYPAPQAQLDLHGATASRAIQQAGAFIRRARADGLFTVRIIVGKGLHSESGAVLPDVVEDLLVAMKREDLILSYRWEKRLKRKSGALIVFLATDFR
jgi:DNA-nicking Smr family endonuclease